MGICNDITQSSNEKIAELTKVNKIVEIVIMSLYSLATIATTLYIFCRRRSE